ncbi:MAG: hypothetical protein A2156_05810 [Deltaproteobacteria bacterium RBG_16_48_10]|nr:MAG: hypothetical protein A2156_05810 [Deltaproteobacteria bacterium RBG_16_48_10]
MRKALISLFMLLLLSPALALAGAADEANALVDRWAATFTANDAEAILKLYTNDAVLLGTVSPVIADSAASRRAYFSRLPGSGNKCVIGDRRTVIINDTAVLVTGFYDFTIMQAGKLVESPARFSMLLVKRGNDWLIAHHHSSARPKPPG